MKTFLSIVLISIMVLIIFYILMIMPRMRKRPDIRPFQGVLYAHRGLHDNETDAPENSMAAFCKAVEAGFGIELDIQLTKDKIPVVFHDMTLKRICGEEGRICDYTYKELQKFALCKSTERIPKLEDVLDMVGGRVPLIVEFKGETTDIGLCPVADKLLREYKGVYCMESFNPLMVAWYRKNHGDIFRGQLSEKFFTKGEKSLLHFVLQHLFLNFLAKPDFIAYNCKDYNELSRRICCGLFGATAVAWTIKSEDELADMKKHFDLFIFDSFVPNMIPSQKS
ncbi:MAG: glycerophosphodiester phosphodiesterase [Lachnospiraceae bacterium]|nr:glycerophosphodiester phosphodiesterase [Lachnospiraceae bacterium]